MCWLNKHNEKQNEEDARERWELVRDLKLKKKGILYAYYLIWKWLEFISVEYNMSCHMIYMYFIVAILVCSPNAVQRCQYNVNYVIFVWMMRAPIKPD